VRRVISEVLMVPLEDVKPGVSLVHDLGAESIDFLDLVFRIEEIVGKKVPVKRWEGFLNRLQESEVKVISPEVMAEFARQERDRE
jgi:acyl carrier protein